MSSVYPVPLFPRVLCKKWLPQLPLELGREVPEDSTSDMSYHMTPFASSSVPTSLLPIVESNKENMMILYDSCKSLVEIVDSPVENVVPLPVAELSLDFAGISWLIAIRGQRAICSQGRPKLSFHPYASCCCLGQHSSTHQSSSLCLGFETEGQVGHEGPNSLGQLDGGVAEHGGWANGQGQQ